MSPNGPVPANGTSFPVVTVTLRHGVGAPIRERWGPIAWLPVAGIQATFAEVPLGSPASYGFVRQLPA